MLHRRPNDRIPLPKDWPRRVRSAVVHTIALAQTALTHARSVAANSASARTRKGRSGSKFVRREQITRVRQQLKNYTKLRALVDRWIEAGAELSNLRLEEEKG